MTEIIKAPELTSERLRFVDMSEEDAPFVIALRSEPDIYQYFINPHLITLQEHMEWYRNRYVFDANRFDWIAFSANGERVGIFGVKRIDSKDDSAEISYILSRDFYKKGYASEAVKRIIKFCRDEWKCSKIMAEIHKDNIQSFRLIERLGFIKSSCTGDFEIWELKYDSISC